MPLPLQLTVPHQHGFCLEQSLAIVNIINADNRQYDVNAKVALTYKPTQHLTLAANLGLYYNYDQEGLFVPGVNNQEIMPQIRPFSERPPTWSR
jgi:ligand-binding sensor domain-containing protein